MDNTTQSSKGESNLNAVVAAMLVLAVVVFGGIYLSGGSLISQKAATGDAVVEKDTGEQTVDRIIEDDVWPVAKSVGWSINSDTKKAVRGYNLISKDEMSAITVTNQKTGKVTFSTSAVTDFLRKMGGAIVFFPIVDNPAEGIECIQLGTNGTIQCTCSSPSWSGGWQSGGGGGTSWGDWEACLDQLLSTA